MIIFSFKGKVVVIELHIFCNRSDFLFSLCCGRMAAVRKIVRVGDGQKKHVHFTAGFFRFCNQTTTTDNLIIRMRCNDEKFLTGKIEHTGYDTKLKLNIQEEVLAIGYSLFVCRWVIDQLPANLNKSRLKRGNAK